VLGCLGIHVVLGESGLTIGVNELGVVLLLLVLLVLLVLLLVQLRLRRLRLRLRLRLRSGKVDAVGGDAELAE
jgi:hypothetical protein